MIPAVAPSCPFTSGTGIPPNLESVEGRRKRKVKFEQGILAALFIIMIDSDQIDLTSFYSCAFR